MSEWQFQWLRSIDEIEDSEFNAQWQALANAASEARIFQEPLMAKAWLETRGFAQNVQPAFCIAKHADGSEVILPLCRLAASWQKGYACKAVALGEPNFDYQCPIGARSNGQAIYWPDFWDALKSEIESHIQWLDSLFVTRLMATIAPISATEDGAKASPICRLANYASFDDYLTKCSKSHRGDVRRQVKRLTELGPLQLKVFEPIEIHAAQDELSRMIAAYNVVWGRPDQPHLFQIPGIRDYYQQVINTLLPVGLLHFSVLYLNQEPISWHFGFLHRRNFHYYKPTYAVSHEKYSPGKVHLAMLIELGIQAGWELFDFGAGLEAYKFLWTHDVIALKQIRWTSNTLRSRLFETMRNLKAGLH